MASVASQIPRIKSSKDASRVVSRVFSSSFDRNSFRLEHCAEVGENLYDALKANDLLK
jgi:hypothetical protein